MVLLSAPNLSLSLTLCLSLSIFLSLSRSFSFVLLLSGYLLVLIMSRENYLLLLRHLTQKVKATINEIRTCKKKLLTFGPCHEAGYNLRVPTQGISFQFIL